MKALLLLTFFLACFTVNAEIILPQIFSDNMVLQCQMPIKIWGKATPSTKVGVEFSEQKAECVAGSNGDWAITLKPVEPSKTPQTLKIFENGKAVKEISNVLVGEVWVLGGQSNMSYSFAEFPMKSDISPRLSKIKLRTFHIPFESISETPQFQFPQGSKWHTVSPDDCSFAGVLGWFFAEKISRELDVPVATIMTARGATRMACHMPAETMDKNSFTKKLWGDFLKDKAAYTKEEYQRRYKEWEDGMKEYNQKKRDAEARGQPVPKFKWTQHVKPFPETPWWPVNTPTYNWNAKIAPLANYAVRGVLWYQGESDSSGDSVKEFENQFSNLISAWRKAWGNKKMPFYFVQLASFDTPARWPEVRDAQMQAFLKGDQLGIATAIDLGERNNIHPAQKEKLALRLADIALKNTYGRSGLCAYGPIFSNASYKGKKVEIHFDTLGKKLTTKGEIIGFEIFSDGKWITPKSAKISGNDIVLEADSEILGVRYLWASWNPNISLFNSEGLPAFPFMDMKRN